MTGDPELEDFSAARLMTPCLVVHEVLAIVQFVSQDEGHIFHRPDIEYGHSQKFFPRVAVSPNCGFVDLQECQRLRIENSHQSVAVMEIVENFRDVRDFGCGLQFEAQRRKLSQVRHG